MLTYILDSNTPLYEQIYRHIKADIEQGVLSPHQKVPSKRGLSSHLVVSQNTVENAYDQLISEGYLYSRPKSGYFVEDIIPIQREQKSYNLASSAVMEGKEQYRYDFTTNAVDIDSFPFATWARLTRDVMNEDGLSLLKATHPQGDVNLREQLCLYLSDYRGIRCHPEQIIVGAGSEYLMELAIKLIGRDVVYGIENPGYKKIQRILTSNAAPNVAVGLDEYGVDIKLLYRSAADVLHTTPSRHFPLGTIMPVKRRMELLDWANAKQGRYILEDDYDSEFRFSGLPIPAMQTLDENDKIIYFNTFNKTLAPSLRIGYTVLPYSLLDKYKKELYFYSSTVSNFEQKVLYRFLRDGHFDRHLRRMRTLYKTKRDTLVKAIKRADGNNRTVVMGDNAGLHIILQVSNGMSGAELKASVVHLGVNISSVGDYYYGEPPMPDNKVVLNYAGLSEGQLVQAVNLMADAWGL